MSKGVIALQFLGRLGNCMFSYAFARAYAERHDLELQTDPWIGQKVFGLNDQPIANPDKLAKRCENTLVDGEGDILFRSYCQQQKCLIYTRRDCLRWFKFSDEIHTLLTGINIHYSLGHKRDGDYAGYGYPVVSELSYSNAVDEFNEPTPLILSEHRSPYLNYSLPAQLKDIPDFYIMTKAKVLFRGNSTYSWWAGTLNKECRIYSPIMSNAIGGKENDCQFVRGNWPAFRTDLQFLTDLHLPE